jgi:hypothetical protein
LAPYPPYTENRQQHGASNPDAGFAHNPTFKLRRGLEHEGCGFVARGNKFVHLDDYALARRLPDQQLDTRWRQVLDGFLPAVFPAMKDLPGPPLSYLDAVAERMGHGPYLSRRPPP